VTRQLQVQPPSAQPSTPFAPLRGRKVLLFSDSRQTAARLAANIQGYSFSDTMRPLIVVGYRLLAEQYQQAQRLTLQDLYCAILVASAQLDVRLRPELIEGENMTAAQRRVSEFLAAYERNENPDPVGLVDDIRAARPPQALLKTALECLTHKYYGLESLALASLVERPARRAAVEALPNLPGVAETPEQKRGLTRAWLRCWQEPGFWLGHMPTAWWPKDVTGHKGTFQQVQRLTGDRTRWRTFLNGWLPKLLELFTEPQGNVYRLQGQELSLEIGGAWAYCTSCRTTQRPFPDSARCVQCGKETAQPLNPDTDPVFRARKGYYRAGTLAALQDPPQSPMAFIAAEHTAQLNTAQADDVFSKAEEHELLFQDVPIGARQGQRAQPAIDVLSCTTTMEVGIDIGSLSGVALRNMPPARANYQQRAGRAGRRGNAVATVVAFGSADSHDEHYFRNPDQMIRGPVADPLLSLDNAEITRRHVTAYLLQRYHQDRLPHIAPEASLHLFEVLGTVQEFLTADAPLNRGDFGRWLGEKEAQLRTEVEAWVPSELPKADRDALLAQFVPHTLAAIDQALDVPAGEEGPAEVAAEPEAGNDEGADELPAELAPEEEDANTSRSTRNALTNLLDRLLYRGVLPRYAFPTDVATFHVFDRENWSSFRPTFRYTPSQGLAAALSQYAPSREVWIDRKMWLSGAIYSPFDRDRRAAWNDHRRWYYECSACGYAYTSAREDGNSRDVRDCEACGGTGTIERANAWLRPPGFAHPAEQEPATSVDDLPERSYATRAKLSAPTPADADSWQTVTPLVRLSPARELLLVTNRGPRNMGYHYCVLCGRIDAAAARNHPTLGAHLKPFPHRDQQCDGQRTALNIVLGTDFYTDILLISLRVGEPARLRTDVLATQMALRTVCEALVKAATEELGLEPGELEADFRPALTPEGRTGQEAEIYLYDTLAGGAGFSRRVAGVGAAVLRRALALLEDCPANCDGSCYRCLRSFRNRLEHALLDRALGASLLRYLLDEEPLTLPSARLERSYNLLAEDLGRNVSEDLTVARNEIIDVPGLGARAVPLLLTAPGGRQIVVDLSHPLTPGVALQPDIQEIAEFSCMPTVVESEIVVRRNLPHATQRILDECL